MLTEIEQHDELPGDVLLEELIGPLTVTPRLKLRPLSDLHLEFGPLDLDYAGEDAVVLAGDIAIHTDGVEWAEQVAQKFGVPVVMVAGNHEFYRGHPIRPHTYESTIEALRNSAAKTGGAVVFLEDGVTFINGVRIIGASLWTDFALHGNAPMAMVSAIRLLNDYVCISEDSGRHLQPETVQRRHLRSRRFIESALREGYAGSTIVVTHHAPSGHSIAGRYADDKLSPCYASNLESLMSGDTAPVLWLHGHVHHSFDYQVGQTRIVGNPRGYYRMETNPEFNPNLIVEV